MSDAAREPEKQRPTLRAMLGWSAAMMAFSLLVALLALPILHWLGFDPK